jgi:hypothetical protein
LVKHYRTPENAFARRYNSADEALLAQADRLVGGLSGPATKRVRCERLGDVSVGCLYNLRASTSYRALRAVAGAGCVKMRWRAQAHFLRDSLFWTVGQALTRSWPPLEPLWRPVRSNPTVKAALRLG